MLAALYGYDHILEMLLSHGANVNLEDKVVMMQYECSMSTRDVCS